MHSRFKLLHHRHSGRLRAHEYTSYAPLGILLVVVGIALTVYSVSAVSPGPEGGSVGLSGTMPGPPPTTAAVIQVPSNQQHFGTSPVTVSGTCPKDSLVEVYKNDIFAGSGPCTDAGTFSFQVDLLFGPNKLIARVYNALNQPGPDSNTVAVSYDALPPQGSTIAPLNFGGAQLILNTNAVYRGTFPGQELSVPIDILGGTAPYAVNVQWGDTSNKVIPRNNNFSFTTTHTYNKAGTYQITLQATDSAGRMAFLTVAAIVNGQPAATISNTNAKSAQSRLLILWPLYTSAAAVAVSFWLGERREKYILASIPIPTRSRA